MREVFFFEDRRACIIRRRVAERILAIGGIRGERCARVYN